MPLNDKLGLFGLAKQTLKGTPATPPVYGHGLTSGGLSLARDPAAMKLSSGTRVSVKANVTSQTPGAAPVSPAYVASLGAYLLAALGFDTVTGTTTKLHTFSVSSLPWYTLYQMIGGSEYLSISDAKCSSLKLSWTGASPLALETDWTGMNIAPGAALWTPTTSLDGSGSYLTPVGGTFQMSAADGTPVTAQVIGGDITVTNALDVQTASGSTLPAVVQEGELEGAVSLTVIPDDLRTWQAAVTGTTSGTSLSQIPVYGSMSLQFVEAEGGPGFLTVAATKCVWDVPYPNPSNTGAAVQLGFTGLPLAATSAGQPLAFGLSNTVTSY